MPKAGTIAREEHASADESVARILADIAAQHLAWSDFLSQLHPEQAMQPADGLWSAIDALVHATAWIENALRIARLQAEPNEPDLGPTRGAAGYLHINVDKFNADVFQAHRGWTRERALEWSQRTNAELRGALTVLPVERILGGSGRHGARMWFWMPAFIHTRGHRHRVMRQLLGEVE